MHAHLRAPLARAGAPARLARALLDFALADADDDDARALGRAAAAAAWRLSKTPSLVDELCFAGVLTAAFKAADAAHTDATTTNLLKHLEYRLSC